MCGRAYQPRFLFAWPNARTAVMGPDQASNVLTQVRADSYAAQGKSWSEEESKAYSDEIRELYLKQSDALYGTAQLWDDGIIDPVNTRATIDRCLDATANKLISEPVSYGIFRM